MNEDAAVGALAGLLVGGLLMIAIYLSVVVLMIVGMWKTFTTAGKPGWAAIIPIYNMIVLLEIAGRPLWWVLLLLVPCVNIVFCIIVYIDLAKNFGRGAGFGIGLAFIPFIFFPLLGFDESKYQPVAKG